MCMLLWGSRWQDRSAIKNDGGCVIVMNVVCQSVTLMKTLASVLADQDRLSSVGPPGEVVNSSGWFRSPSMCQCAYVAWTVTKGLYVVLYIHDDTHLCSLTSCRHTLKHCSWGKNYYPPPPHIYRVGTESSVSLAADMNFNLATSKSTLFLSVPNLLFVSSAELQFSSGV